MQQLSLVLLLKQHGLRDTQPRRMVVEAMRHIRKPVSPYDIEKWISAKGGTVSIVTVYRVLAVLEKLHLVHRHVRSGGVILCSLQGREGHHVLLSCEGCGTVQECSDAALCAREDQLAKRAGFSPKIHFSEIVGMCSLCH